MKVVINVDFGGFGLSDKAIEKIMKRKGLECHRYKITDDYKKYIKCGSDEVPGLFGFTYLTKDLGDHIDGDVADNYSWYYGSELKRNDVDLVCVISELGEVANGKFSHLKVVEMPDDVEWEISEYDGWESIHEVHRVWN